MRSGRPRSISDEKVAEVIKLTLEKKPEGMTHWSTRLLAKETKLSQSTVSRIWRAFGIKPHRQETFTLSTDPFFIEIWHKQRIKQKMNIRVIYNDTEQTRERIKKHKESLALTKYRFLPIKVESPTPALIYENKLVFVHLVKKDPFAVMIDNSAMADNYRKYFEELWNAAKK